jgi:2-polyprenyl-6-methoxyphenol hydroxylase-like FAD-dependent oxidoreductase
MTNTPLIIGAGPTGLAAALFLAKQGVDFRIIDAAHSPSPYSRALAVNPRTLELLEPTGVTAKMLGRGLRIKEVDFQNDNKEITKISLSGIKHRYPFLLALSQAATEAILTESLQELGKEVERDVKLTSCKQENGVIEASIETNGNTQKVTPAWLFAADGAHSIVRQQLGLDFEGSGFAEAWYLLDLPLKTDLPLTSHVRFFDNGGFLFLIPVIEDMRRNVNGDPLWRVLGNFPDLLGSLQDATPSGAAVWESNFRVSHRMVSQMNVGNIYLAGDAAHIHSPIGARGMNLGIEDAWTFAELFKDGKLERYGSIRQRIDAKVVKRVKLLTTVARGQSGLTRLARRMIFPLVPKVPFLYQQVVRTASGLDHDVEL